MIWTDSIIFWWFSLSFRVWPECLINVGNTSCHEVFWVLSPEFTLRKAPYRTWRRMQQLYQGSNPSQPEQASKLLRRRSLSWHSNVHFYSKLLKGKLSWSTCAKSQKDYKRRQQVQRICLSFAKGWTDSKQVKLKWIPLKSALFTRDLRPLGVLPLVVFGCSLQLLQFCSAVHHAEKSVKSYKNLNLDLQVFHDAKKKNLPTPSFNSFIILSQIQCQLPKWSVSYQLRVTWVRIFKNRKYSK
jgi:5-methylcytosine-specific restriction endonuclease McrA